MIRIIEVGPRDGLQNEPETVATETKIALVDALSQAGVDEIEVSAFVSPKWVPQLADALAVFRGIKRHKGVSYSALVPNMHGLERAVEAQASRVAVFTAASESFTRKNINASVDQSFGRFVPVISAARELNLPIRGYVSTAFWCPYEGRIAPKSAAQVILRLFDLGVEEVSIGDTVGKAKPDEVTALLSLLPKDMLSAQIAMHFHDTYGHARANARRSYEFGVETFDSSVGGLGGCPFAPGASGNVSTEGLVGEFRDVGAPVRVDLEKLAAGRKIMEETLHRRLGRPSRPDVDD